jgi:ribosome-associated protein
LKLSSTRLAYLVSRLVLAKKASNIRLLDLRQLTDVTDYFVICTASADLHGRAIAESLVDEMERKKIKPLHKEGYQKGSWILLDFVDVVVHIFLKEAREFYNLEGLWGDAPGQTLSDKGRFLTGNGQRKNRRTEKQIRHLS